MNTRSARRSSPAAPAAKSKQQVVSEWRRDTILDAAAAIIARDGVGAATIEEVARAAGLAKGTIYLSFRSKDELYRALLDRAVTELHERTAAAIRAASGGRDTVRAVIATRLAHFDEHRDFFRLYHFEDGNLLRNHERLHVEFRERHLAQVRLLAEALQACARDGSLREVPAERTAFLLFDLTKGLIVSRLLDPAPPPLSEEIELLTDLAWRGLAP